VAADPKSAEGLIELRIAETAHLFDPLDPFPVPSRDLSKTAEDFIVEWARELPKDAPIRILVHIPAEELKKCDIPGLKTAFANHFRQRARSVSADLHEMFRIGRRSLAIGLAVLALCVLSSQTVLVLMNSSAPAHILSEGLVILGWVANWRPIEIFLYDWWPLVRRRKLYQRLSQSTVETKPN
jgi:hypothetical protein